MNQIYVALSDVVPVGPSYEKLRKERIVGFSYHRRLVNEYITRLYYIGVLQEFRRLGLGRMLLNEIMASSTTHRIMQLSLDKENEKGVNFFKGLGFGTNMEGPTKLQMEGRWRPTQGTWHDH